MCSRNGPGRGTARSRRGRPWPPNPIRPGRRAGRFAPPCCSTAPLPCSPARPSSSSPSRLVPPPRPATSPTASARARSCGWRLAPGRSPRTSRPGSTAASSGGGDQFLNQSPDGKALVLQSERFGCAGNPCLAVVSSNFKSGQAVAGRHGARPGLLRRGQRRARGGLPGAVERRPDRPVRQPQDARQVEQAAQRDRQGAAEVPWASGDLHGLQARAPRLRQRHRPVGGHPVRLRDAPRRQGHARPGAPVRRPQAGGRRLRRREPSPRRLPGQRQGARLRVPVVLRGRVHLVLRRASASPRTCGGRARTTWHRAACRTVAW